MFRGSFQKDGVCKYSGAHEAATSCSSDQRTLDSVQFRPATGLAASRRVTATSSLKNATIVCHAAATPPPSQARCNYRCVVASARESNDHYKCRNINSADRKIGDLLV